MRKWIVLLGVLALTSCTSRKGLHHRNVAHLYQQTSLIMQPQFVVYHESDEQSKVHYRIASKDLLYMKQDQKAYFESNLRVAYKLIPSYEIVTVLDSGSFMINHRQKELVNSPIEGYFDIKAPRKDFEGNYLLHVSLYDANRKYIQDHYISIYKTGHQQRQNFLLLNEKGKLIYDNVLVPGQIFKLRYNREAPTNLSVRYYNRSFPIASPPYSITGNKTFDYKADSIFSITANEAVRFQQSGFYHFQADSSNKDGFTLFCFYQDFPGITRKTHLAPPLRYITSKDEYKKMNKKDPDSTKVEVDQFWVKHAGSIERAQTLVRSYYNRVQDANRYFSSYMEGWKTDRGIIYVVYGPPNIVYRSSDGETWIYGEENSSLSYHFNFNKVPNPFTDNDFSLDRSDMYRYSWVQATEAWRQGRVYNVRDIKREQDERDRQLQYQQPYFWH